MCLPMCTPPSGVVSVSVGTLVSQMGFTCSFSWALSEQWTSLVWSWWEWSLSVEQLITLLWVKEWGWTSFLGWGVLEQMGDGVVGTGVGRGVLALTGVGYQHLCWWAKWNWHPSILQAERWCVVAICGCQEEWGWCRWHSDQQGLWHWEGVLLLVIDFKIFF